MSSIKIIGWVIPTYRKVSVIPRLMAWDMGYNTQVEILSFPTMSSEQAAPPEGAIAPHERPFLITGLPRSGTSMTAGIFATLGLWTGTTVPGGPENPKGFFEHVALREQVTKGILAGHGFDPVGVRKLPPRDFNPNIRFNNSLTLRQTIEAIIRDDGYEPHRRWMYKGATMSRFGVCSTKRSQKRFGSWSHGNVRVLLSPA